MKKGSQGEVGGGSCCDNNHMQPAGFDACQLTLWTPPGCFLWWVLLCLELLRNTCRVLLRQGNFKMRPIYPKPWLIMESIQSPKKRNYSECEQRSFIRCADSWRLEFKISIRRRSASGHRSLWFWAFLTRSKGRCWGHSVSVVDSIFSHTNEQLTARLLGKMPREANELCRGARNLIQQIFILKKYILNTQNTVYWFEGVCKCVCSFRNEFIKCEKYLLKLWQWCPTLWVKTQLKGRVSKPDSHADRKLASLRRKMTCSPSKRQD